ncbi:energy transducer TonB [Sphingomonas sp. KR3-1]|uniref:energy transducer TonB family protein n=1 Tax=Sphingomonas sp. KR3-1 TaxID=3156611 RepID=UPI0032B36930
MRRSLTPAHRSASALAAAGALVLVFLLLRSGLAVMLSPAAQERPLPVDFVALPPPALPKVVPSPIPPRAHRLDPGAPAPLPAPHEAPTATLAPLAPAAPVSAPVAGPGGSGVGTAQGSGGTGAGGIGGGSGSGIPAPAPPRPRLVPPDWVRKPSPEDLRRLNPPGAQAMNQSGDVVLACHVLATRRADRCRVVRETPRGYFFGAAALDASRDFRINPPMRGDAVDPDAWVVIPVHFAND